MEPRKEQNLSQALYVTGTLLWTEYFCPPKIHVEALAPPPHHVIVFGDGFSEVIRFRSGHESGAPQTD